MKKKPKVAILLLLALLFIGLFTGCSESNKSDIMIPEVKNDVYVYDQGEFLDDGVEEQMNALLDQLEEETSIEFAVITIPSLNNLSIEEYAVKLGNELGIGKADTDNGILLLISKTDTEVRLEIGNGMQGILTDSVSGRILDNFFVPYRDEENYDDASLSTVQAVINYLAESDEYEISIEGIDSTVALEPEEEIPWYYYVIAIILLILLLIIIEWVTGNIFGDGFGDGLIFIILDSSSSGGSDGGGGFGGGSFSGGGASR